MIYATPGDLASFLDVQTPPTNSSVLLRHASGLVRRATYTAIYDTDTDGYPTDSVKRQAMRDAACAQAEAWLSISTDPAAGAADGGKIVASKNLASAAIQYVNYERTAAARARAASTLSPEAVRYLRDAGLTGTEPIVAG